MEDKSNKKFSKSPVNKDINAILLEDYFNKVEKDDKYFKEFEEKHTNLTEYGKTMSESYSAIKDSFQLVEIYKITNTKNDKI